jgi:hypothetical protein
VCSDKGRQPPAIFSPRTAGAPLRTHRFPRRAPAHAQFRPKIAGLLPRRVTPTAILP